MTASDLTDCACTSCEPAVGWRRPQATVQKMRTLNPVINATDRRWMSGGGTSAVLEFASGRRTAAHGRLRQFEPVGKPVLSTPSRL
jgi:hypothetical protein